MFERILILVKHAERPHYILKAKMCYRNNKSGNDIITSFESERIKRQVKTTQKLFSNIKSEAIDIYSFNTSSTAKLAKCNYNTTSFKIASVGNIRGYLLCLTN